MSSPAATPLTVRRGLWRWLIALVATVALVVSGSGLVVFAQSGAGESQGPQFVPADTPIYIEARLDMPAGQDEAVAQMLTAFPGFADAGAFDMKIDELIGSLGAQMGVAVPEGSLFGDVLTGEIGIAVGDLETIMTGGGDPALLIGMAVADPAAAASMAEALMGRADAEVSETTYNDVAIMTDESSTPPTSMAMHGDWMLLGNGSSQVEAAIDVLDGNVPSLADNPDYTTAVSRLPSARLGAAYVNLAAFGSLVDMAGMMAEGQVGVALPTVDLAAMLPKDMVMSLSAEADRMNLDVFVTPGEQTPAAVVGESDLASAFPADTQIYLETRELGAAVQAGLNGLVEVMAAQQPMTDEMGSNPMAQLEMLFGDQSPVTAMLGVPLPEFLDFVGDTSMGASLSSDGLWLGIAGEVNDQAAAQQRVTSLMTIIRLLTAQEGSGISVATDTVDGVDVTTITVPLDQMLAESGLPITVGNTISVALDGNKLLIGMGDFVQSAIASDGTDSLATNAGYIDALGDDTPNAGVTYVNVSSLLSALDPMLAMMAPQWADIAPYATGIDRMIVVPTADDEVLSARMTVIVGQ